MSKYEIDPQTGYTIAKRPDLARFDPAMKTTFLTVLLKNLQAHPLSLNVQAAADEVGISKRVVFHHLQQDEKFAEDYWEIRDRWLDNHETSVAEFGKRNFVASLAVLRAHRPDKWRDKTTVQHQAAPDNMKAVLELMKKKGYLQDVAEIKGDTCGE